MRVVFFGALKDAAGAAEREITPPDGARTLGDLRDWLGAQDPALAAALNRPGVRMALDQEFAGPDAEIAGAREAAFMAPLSGG